MAYTPGDHIEATRTYTSGRTGLITGKVIEDYGYGLLLQDDASGHRIHLATNPANLAQYGVTQTITVTTPA